MKKFSAVPLFLLLPTLCLSNLNAHGGDSIRSTFSTVTVLTDNLEGKSLLQESEIDYILQRMRMSEQEHLTEVFMGEESKAKALKVCQVFSIPERSISVNVPPNCKLVIATMSRMGEKLTVYINVSMNANQSWEHITGVYNGKYVQINRFPEPIFSAVIPAMK